MGVAAIDITLRSVNQILANSKVTPDTRVALINGRGEVLSSHLGAAALIPAADGKGRMPTIDDLELPMLKKLMAESVGVQSGTRSFTDDQGNTWEGGVFRFSIAPATVMSIPASISTTTRPNGSCSRTSMVNSWRSQIACGS